MERCFEVAALPEQFGWRKLSVQRGLQQLLREILALTQPEHELRGGIKEVGWEEQQGRHRQWQKERWLLGYMKGRA